jgi:hypothetical protein
MRGIIRHAADGSATIPTGSPLTEVDTACTVVRANLKTQDLRRVLMSQFVSPLSLTPEQRRENLAALNARVASATGRVAADRSQTAATRRAATRDNATARRIARALES